MNIKINPKKKLKLRPLSDKSYLRVFILILMTNITKYQYVIVKNRLSERLSINNTNFIVKKFKIGNLSWQKN